MNTLCDRLVCIAIVPMVLSDWPHIKLYLTHVYSCNRSHVLLNDYKYKVLKMYAEPKPNQKCTGR